MKRLAIAAVVGVFGLALLPVSASARLIGPALPISHDYHWATFDHGPGITSVASNMKAPFDGKITRVRLEAIEGNVKVQVIRQRNGRYTVIRESGWRGVNSVLQGNHPQDQAPGEEGKPRRPTAWNTGRRHGVRVPRDRE